MEEQKGYGLIAFSHTHGAMAAEKHLKKYFKIRMMPLLREISASCGIAIRFDLAEIEGVQAQCAALDQKSYTLYQVQKTKGKTEVTQWKK